MTTKRSVKQIEVNSRPFAGDRGNDIFFLEGPNQSTFFIRMADKYRSVLGVSNLMLYHEPLPAHHSVKADSRLYAHNRDREPKGWVWENNDFYQPCSFPCLTEAGLAGRHGPTRPCHVRSVAEICSRLENYGGSVSAKT